MDRSNIEVALERVEVAARVAFGPQVLHDAKASAVLDEQTGRLVVQLRSFVYAERLEPIVETATHSHPRSPWQGFKARHWPAFLLRLFPVRDHKVTATFKINRLRAFPDNATVFPDNLGSHVAMYQPEPPYWKT